MAAKGSNNTGTILLVAGIGVAAVATYMMLNNAAKMQQQNNNYSGGSNDVNSIIGSITGGLTSILGLVPQVKTAFAKTPTTTTTP